MPSSGIECSTYKKRDSSSLVPWMLTPFNYTSRREDMQVSLCNTDMFRMPIGTETDPQHHVEKNKFLNRLDEAFKFICTHISRDLLFHLEGLWNPKEAWDKLKYLFGKQDELRGHILKNGLIALQPTGFKTIRQLFTPA